MPYILLKRSDVPADILQTLEIRPYTVQWAFSYGLYGQTGYRIPPTVATVALTNAAGTITFTNQTEGLAAWFLTNVDNGGSAVASMTLNIAPGNAAPGDTVLVDTSPVGGPAAPPFIFVPGAPATPEEVMVGIDNLTSAVNLALQISAHPVIGTYVQAIPNVGAPGNVDINGAAVGTFYNGILVTTVGANIVPPGPTPLTGGLDANALTAAEADQNVQDVLGLMNFDLAGPPADMDLAAINGALTTGTIAAGDVASILDILAGRQYLVPADVQIETGAAFSVVPAVGATGGPNWDVDQGFRRLYESAALRIAFNKGRLSLWSDAAYILNGTTGALVAVYNDDGTLYTGA